MIYNIIFSYILILGLYYDSRIKLNRKFLIILLFIILWIISIYIEKVPYMIIKDLFWYSLVLNGSFIIHVLLLSWVYRICWLNKWEYSCFLISRFSFIFSLSCLVHLLHIFNRYIYNNINNKKANIYNILYYIVNIINIVLRYFIIIFHSYVIFVMGLNIEDISKVEYIDKFLNIYRNLEFIFFTLAISIIIGFPRLYMIWIFFFLKKGFDLYNKNFNILDILKFLLTKEIINVPSILLYENIEMKQMEILANIYKKPYYTFFMFDLLKFLFIEGKYIGCHNIEELEEGEFPIKTPFKYYPWIKIMREYYNNREIIGKHSSLTEDKYYWRTIEERFTDLMNMCGDINLDKKQYILISDELPEGLDDLIVQNQEIFYYDKSSKKFKLKNNINKN